MITEQIEQQSDIQQNGEETHKKNYGQKIITNEPIENTPFRLIGNPAQGYAIAIGLKRLTEPKPTIEEAKEILTSIEWNFIANMIVAITQTYDEVENKREFL